MNVYTRHRIPLQKMSDDCPEVEYTGILREFEHDHADCRLRGVIGMLMLSLSSTSLLPSFMVRLDGYCSKISSYTQMSIVMQFNMRVLCLLPPLVALFLHGILMILVHLSSTVIIIVSSTCMRVSKFPFTN